MSNERAVWQNITAYKSIPKVGCESVVCFQINSFSTSFKIIAMDVESRLSGAEELAWKQIGVLQTEMPSAAQHESEVIEKVLLPVTSGAYVTEIDSMEAPPVKKTRLDYSLLESEEQNGTVADCPVGKFPDFSDMADLDLQPECNREMIETLFGTDVNHNIDPEGLLDSKCSGSDELASLMEGQSESELLGINDEQEAVHKEPEMVTDHPTKLFEIAETSFCTNIESKPAVICTANSGVLDLFEAKEVSDVFSETCTGLRAITNQAQIQVSENFEKDKTTLLVEELHVNVTENSKASSLSSTMDVATPSINRELETCLQPAVKAASTDTSDRPQPCLPPHYSEMKTETVKTATVSTQAVHKPVDDQCADNSNAAAINKGDEKDVTSTTASGKDESDAFGLEWKDGIATLPGSNLKFRMTEFGTLEILSTVETEKGEVEWSTATGHKKQPNKEKAETATKSKMAEASLLEGPPDANQILCCEVCGKYGLPQDFSASGRFCGLSCVGVYTGRRNKGREFVKHAFAVDGKITKRRKKGKGKKSALGKMPAAIQEGNPNAEVNSEGQPVMSPKPKGAKRERRKRNSVRLEGVGTSLTAETVPYQFTKAFAWDEYLFVTATKAAPISAFKQEIPDRDVFAFPCSNEFRKDMKLEAVDPKHPSYICVCTVVRVKGSRLRLHFDGWSESYDFWTNSDSPFIYPVGWCEKHNQLLNPPRGMSPQSFKWDVYLRKTGARAVPSHLFKLVSLTPTHGFKMGMKLEAIDRKNPDLTCVATVTNVIGNHFLVHFDEWDDTYDYWCKEDCPYIHSVGWCQEVGKKLNPPNDDEVDTFTWHEYFQTSGTTAAQPELFKKRVPPSFQHMMKLEAVDRRNPSLVRAATIADVQEYKVRVHYDGWDDIYDDWFDADSPDLHPVGWCEKTGHPLEPPLTTADKIASAACPTPGCKGIGHVKGAKYSTHHSTFGCPYSLQNLNKDSCLVDRLSTNSMTEESDWSYASKQKSPATKTFKEEKEIGVTDWVCPTAGCDGSGHVTGRWSSHHSISGCPKNEANLTKVVKSPVSESSARTSGAPVRRPPQGTPGTETTTAASTVKVSSSIITTRSSMRKQNREDRREKIVERSNPNVTVVSRPSTSNKTTVTFIVPSEPFPWPGASGFQGGEVPVSDEVRASERDRIAKWTVADVKAHMTSLGCPEQARIFAEELIDGEAFLLLTQTDIVNILKIKLGPALKIFNTIPK